MRGKRSRNGAHAKFESLCGSLANLDRVVLGKNRRARIAREREKHRKLSADIWLAGMDLDAQVLISAGRGALLLLGGLSAGSALVLIASLGLKFAPIVAFAAAALPLLAREAVLSYPARAAARRAEWMMNGVPEAANLMIMSLRHEPSLSRAIRFASERGSEFSDELKGCIWSVVMGRHSSFEDSLQGLGAKWGKHDPELKASIHAMVTASCERTEDGKRRALDRANNEVMTGAKRRIEAYALSLSAPSMVIFGLGILLPLMIGSFLPMMSWSIWSPGEMAPGTMDIGDGNLLETVLLMNIIFPLAALLITIGAISRHPMRSASGGASPGTARMVSVGCAMSVLGATLSLAFLDGEVEMAATLVSGTMPISLALLAQGRTQGPEKGAHSSSRGLEDALFKTGARMLEGENFESALQHAGADANGSAAQALRRLSLRSAVAGHGFDQACRDESENWSDTNALDGLRVVREAAAKDEISAGMLAMDLAAYLKDLHDLETTLKNRLKPTISMMRATAYALGPIVMGVTFAIYLTLMSMAPGGTMGLDSTAFFLVLGIFLAETDGVVSYFVWGIEGAKDIRSLMTGLGSCILVSELVYIATALVSA